MTRRAGRAGTAALTIILLAVLAHAAAAGPTRARGASERAAPSPVRSLRLVIHGYRVESRRWQSAAGRPWTPTSFSERRSESVRYLRWVRDLWWARKARARAYALAHPLRPAHYDGWLCIHSREGSWGASTGNGFYGGLQMTEGWAGRVWHANTLSPMQQMWAAEMEGREHGFASWWLGGQWPNTYPPCAGFF